MKNIRAIVIAACVALLLASLLGLLREVSLVMLATYLVVMIKNDIMGLPSPSKSKRP